MNSPASSHFFLTDPLFLPKRYVLSASISILDFMSNLMWRVNDEYKLAVILHLRKAFCYIPIGTEYITIVRNQILKRNETTYGRAIGHALFYRHIC